MRKEANRKHCFIIGSKGIPARYGGLETFVEKLTQYKTSSTIQYHIARMGTRDFQYEYNKAQCFNVSVLRMGPAKAVYYDLKALQWCIDYCRARPFIKKPVFYILACRIGPFIGWYKKQIRKLGGVLYVNPDGHEWMRRKWSLPVRKYWKVSERLMVRNADLLICDNKNIETYIQNTYKRYRPHTVYIAYGADLSPAILPDDDCRLTKWYKRGNLRRKEYYLVVARFVPENSFDVVIREFMASETKKDLAIITTENHKFAGQLEKRLHYSRDKRIKFMGTVYDQELLKKIRENAYAYLHGHSVGGTNPSLIEALASTDLNLLLNVRFNREVGENAALYWNRRQGNLSRLINRTEKMNEEEIKQLGKRARKRVAGHYTWEKICREYETLFLGGRQSGRGHE